MTCSAVGIAASRLRCCLFVAIYSSTGERESLSVKHTKRLTEIDNGNRAITIRVQIKDKPSASSNSSDEKTRETETGKSVRVKGTRVDDGAAKERMENRKQKRKQ